MIARTEPTDKVKVPGGEENAAISSLPAPLDRLSSEDRAALDPYLQPVTFPPGACLLREGERGDCCYVVDDGLVRIELEREELDTDSVLAYIEPGSLVGEMALLDREPRSASAYAHTAVAARRLSLDALDRLLQTQPRVVAALYAALGRDASRKLRRISARFIETTTHERSAYVDEMLERAARAQEQIQGWPEEAIDRLLAAIAQVVADNAESLAEDAVAETGMGNAADKTIKNRLGSQTVCRSLLGQAGLGLMAHDPQTQVSEIASPVGVVFGLVPVTSPVPTATFKSLIALKSRNAIVLSPHRGAMRVTARAVDLLREVLADHGAPVDVIQVVRERNSRKTTNIFMRHEKVGLILATGGHSLVEAAYSTGKPAIGVGSANTPVLICGDADLAVAARCVVLSKSFDNGTACSAEHNLVVAGAAAPAFAEALERAGAAVLSPEEVTRFVSGAMNPQTRRLQSWAVGADAETIGGTVGLSRPYPIKLIVAPTEGVSLDNPLALEKMGPVSGLFTVEDEDEGFEVCRQLLAIEGSGHTAVIHSRNAEWVQRFGLEMPAGRVLANSPAVHGSIGATTGLIPSFSLGCGTFGGNSTTDNVTYRHLINVKRLATVLPDRLAALGA